MKYAVTVLVEKNRYTLVDGQDQITGYESYTQFTPFDSEKELLKWVENFGKGKKYTAIQFSELEIVTEVKVKQTAVPRKLSESDLYTNTVMSLCD